MKKNVIFDFGQVLVEFSPSKITENYVKDQKHVETISNAVFDRKYWDRLDQGTITDEEVINGFCSELPDHLKSKATEVYKGWVESLTYIEGMPELIKRLKAKGRKIYLLSNISIGFANSYKNFPQVNNLLSLFDGLVFSGVVKKVKPNKDIFHHLLNKYNLNAEDSIFIDDSALNIKGAEAVGIKGYLFDGNADKLSQYLSENFA